MMAPPVKESHCPHPQPLPTRGRGADRVRGGSVLSERAMMKFWFILALGALAGPALAQDYPARPIRAFPAQDDAVRSRKGIAAGHESLSSHSDAGGEFATRCQND